MIPWIQPLIWQILNSLILDFKKAFYLNNLPGFLYEILFWKYVRLE